MSERRLGAKAGAEKVTLTVNQMPSHGHPMQGSTSNGIDPNPQGNVLAGSTVLEPYYDGIQDENFASSAVTSIGGSRSHTNEMPYLCIHFIIALVGIYPSRH